MTTRIIIELGRMTVTMRIAPEDVAYLSPASDPDKDVKLTDEEFALSRSTIITDTAARFSVYDNGARLQHKTGTAETMRDDITGISPHEVIISLTYETTGTAFGKILVDPNLFKPDDQLTTQPPGGGYNNIVSIIDTGKFLVMQAQGQEIYESVVDSAAARAGETSTTSTATSGSPTTTARSP